MPFTFFWRMCSLSASAQVDAFPFLSLILRAAGPHLPMENRLLWASWYFCSCHNQLITQELWEFLQDLLFELEIAAQKKFLFMW